MNLVNEAMKYQSGLTIGKNVAAGADVTNTVFALKDGKKADTSISYSFNADGLADYLTVGNQNTINLKQLNSTGSDFTAKYIVEFTKDGFTYVGKIKVTIEKQ